MNKIYQACLKYQWCQPVFLLLLLLQNTLATADIAGESMVCPSPLDVAGIEKVFRQNALRQLEMEFGRQHLALNDVSQSPVSADLIRVEADAQYRRPGAEGPTGMRLVGWVSRCQGTTLVRRQTWLADGTLSVPRFTTAQLAGEGIIIGQEDAPVRLIAFVDSRCPNCHRLISYAIGLAEKGKLRIELRQVAYLETEDEALQDSRLFETQLVMKDKALLGDAEYLEFLGGFASEEQVDKTHRYYQKAKRLMQNNTRIARKVLHITAVPGVLMQEKNHNNTWRILGYWELNRMMQPGL